MLRSILPTTTFDHYCYSGNGDPEPGGGGGGGGNEPDPGGGGGGSEEDPPKGKLLTEDQFTDRMKKRVNETKEATEKRIAEDLGVPLDEAKRLIAAAKKREDDEKSDAQKAKDAADAAAAKAVTETTEAAQAKHDAKVERELIRHISVPDDVKDEDRDDYIDKKVTRLSRLLEVEVGADAEALKTAVAALKKEEPLLFGVKEEASGGTPPANGDPKGTPPKKTGAESAYERGAKRAAAGGAPGGYPILEKANQPT